MLLELMVERGDIAAAGRSDDGARLWDLAERIYPHDPPVPRDEARRIRDERRLIALGIARASTTKLARCPAPMRPTALRVKAFCRPGR